MIKKVLGVKISKSLKEHENSVKKDINYSNKISEYTKEAWRGTDEKAKNINLILGMKDNIIYTAFEVIDYKKVNNRFEYVCGTIKYELVGLSLEHRGNDIKYFTTDIIENLKHDKASKDKRREILFYYENINLKFE